MVDKVKLLAKERIIKGKQVKSLRREGLLPVVMYGKEKAPLALVVDAHDFELLYRKSGSNTVVSIELEKEDGSTEKKNILIYNVDKDPVKGKIIHADLLRINMNEKITTTVPLKIFGDSEAVLTLGGSLLTTADEIEIECLPGELPHEIEVDVVTLVDFESVIHVSDLNIPTGVTVITDPETVIAHVEAPRSEEELEELEAPVQEGEVPESEHGTAEEEAEQEETESTE